MVQLEKSYLTFCDKILNFVYFENGSKRMLLYSQYKKKRKVFNDIFRGL